MTQTKTFRNWAAFFGLAVLAFLAIGTPVVAHAAAHAFDPLNLVVAGMAWRGKLEPKGATSALVANQPQNIDLTTGVQNRRLLMTVTATVTVANQDGAARVRNRGSVLALISELAVSEGGYDTWQQVDARMLGFLTGILSAAPRTQSLNAVRLSDQALAANAAYNLKEYAVINFGNPLGVSENETFYLEANASQRFQLRVTTNADATRIFAANAGTTTVALSNIIVTLEQDYSITEPGLPYLKPQWRTQTLPVPSASAQLQQLILTQNRLRGIVIQQDTTGVGEVTDIINSFALRGDNADIIGPNQINYAEWRSYHATKYAGADVADGVLGALTGPITTKDTSNAYGFMDFQPDGRLSSLAYPNAQFTNLRFEFNCQPSVVAGAASSVIRIALLEMARPQPVAGKNMVTVELPPFLQVNAAG